MSSFIPIPKTIRTLLEAPSYLRLSTLRADGSPHNHVLWSAWRATTSWSAPAPNAAKARDIRRDPRVGLSVFDLTNPYRMATLQGRVVDVRPDGDYRHMDPSPSSTPAPPSPVEARRWCAS